MKLSKRLQAVADLLDDDLVVADVGTDHGYIPIYLIETGKCKKVFAMDVNEGPLQKAKEHVIENHMCEQIELRLSDGVKALKKDECDAVILAGMGGGLVIRILEDGQHIRDNIKTWILQPQSEIQKVRKYLIDNQYQIVDEDIVEEDGKYYPMMKVINGLSEEYHDIELRYGKILLQKKSPILLQFLDKEIRTKEQILNNLEVTEQAQERRYALRQEIAEARAAYLRCL